MTIPDGTVETAGTVFQKTWRMKNTGTCAWDGGFKFAFAYGTKLGTGNLTITLTSEFRPSGRKQGFRYYTDGAIRAEYLYGLLENANRSGLLVRPGSMCDHQSFKVSGIGESR